VPILPTLECLIDGGTIANIKTMILVFFIMHGGLTDGQTIECVVFLGFNRISTFEGIKSRIIVLMKIQEALYFIGIHPMVHRMNTINLTSISMISKLLHLFQSPYGYSSNSQKCHLEFSKLAKIVETKGNNFLRM
jgi:hypothetical protein